MARKNVVQAFKMIDSGDMSSNIESVSTNVTYLDVSSIAISWSGSSPAGTITIEARNGEANAWTELDFGSTISVSGNSGSHRVVFTEMPFTDLRVVYTASSGTGSLDAIITSKQVGG